MHRPYKIGKIYKGVYSRYGKESFFLLTYIYITLFPKGTERQNTQNGENSVKEIVYGVKADIKGENNADAKHFYGEHKILSLEKPRAKGLLFTVLALHPFNNRV